MPAFEFQTFDGESFSWLDIKQKPSIIIYFDPDCELCEKSGRIISKFQSVHEKNMVIFVSSNNKQKVEEYSVHHKLNKIPNVNFYYCSEVDFASQFKYVSTPSYFIYNSSGNLIKNINEDVPPRIILRYIKASQID